MVCTKCGFDCGDSKYCPKCGTKLIKECRKCGAALSDSDVFCPKCGTDNSDGASSKGWNVVAKISFIATIVIAAIKIVNFLMIRGAIHLAFNSFFYNIPYVGIAFVYCLFAVAVIVFSCLFWKNKKNGFGITAIACATVLRLTCYFCPTLSLLLICTILHYIASLEAKK